MPKVSILVPVYKVSAFIERCAGSLFEQTFADIEYIFVDDASPDDSIEKLERVLENYPERGKQAKIIRQPVNGGSGRARQAGADAASGEYLLFVDADDYIEPGAVESLYRAAEEKRADMVVFDAICEFGDRCRKRISGRSCSRDEFVSDLLLSRQPSYLWNKLFRRELLTGSRVRFLPGVDYCEDFAVVPCLAAAAENIVFLPEAFYHYNQANVGSYTKTFKSSHVRSARAAFDAVSDFFIRRNEAERYACELGYALMLKKLFLYLMLGNCSRPTGENLLEIKRAFPEVSFRRMWMENPRPYYYPVLIFAGLRMVWALKLYCQSGKFLYLLARRTCRMSGLKFIRFDRHVN